MSFLVSLYNKENTDENNGAIIKRVDIITENTKNLELKKLFKTIGNIIRSLRSSNSIIQQIYVYYTYIELAAVYLKLIIKVMEKKETLKR